LLLLAWRGLWRRELLDLIGHRLQIRVQRFFQQASLLGAVALGLGGKLQPLEHGVLVRELVDEGLLVRELGALTDDLLVLAPDRVQQCCDHLAQLLCAEIFQGLLLHHHGPECAQARSERPLEDVPIARQRLCRAGFRPW